MQIDIVSISVHEEEIDKIVVEYKGTNEIEFVSEKDICMKPGVEFKVGVVLPVKSGDGIYDAVIKTIILKEKE